MKIPTAVFDCTSHRSLTPSATCPNSIAKQPTSLQPFSCSPISIFKATGHLPQDRTRTFLKRSWSSWVAKARGSLASSSRHRRSSPRLISTTLQKRSNLHQKNPAAAKKSTTTAFMKTTSSTSGFKIILRHFLPLTLLFWRNPTNKVPHTPP